MKTFTPECTKEVTQDLNVALETVNKIYPTIPLARIVELISRYNLDPSHIVGSLNGDNGRMSVPISADIYFVMSWYRYESTGTFEVVCYATSNYDDYQEPFTTTYKINEKNTRRNRLNAALVALPTYFNGKGLAFACIETAIKDAGFDSSEFQNLISLYGGGASNRYSVHVSNNVYVAVSWFRMPSGNYEIVSYAS